MNFLDLISINELGLYIFSFLKVADISALSLTCRQVLNLTQDNYLWQRLYRRDFIYARFNNNFRELYKIYYTHNFNDGLIASQRKIIIPVLTRCKLTAERRIHPTNFGYVSIIETPES